MFQIVRSHGTNIKRIFEKKIFNNSTIASTCTITPISRTEGEYGGYEAATDTEGTENAVKCVPSGLVNTRVVLHGLGKIEEGELRLFVPPDTTVDENDKVTFNSVDYIVRVIETTPINDVVPFKSLTLVKEVDAN